MSQKETTEAKIELPLDTVLQALSALEHAADITKSKVVKNCRQQLQKNVQEEIARRAEEERKRNLIPPMTDPHSEYWTQPRLENISLDDQFARMKRSDFDLLADYSATIPTGKYLGKMWKMQRGKKWFLCWYGKDPDPKYLAIPTREIVLLD